MPGPPPPRRRPARGAAGRARTPRRAPARRRAPAPGRAARRGEAAATATLTTGSTVETAAVSDGPRRSSAAKNADTATTVPSRATPTSASQALARPGTVAPVATATTSYTTAQEAITTAEDAERAGAGRGAAPQHDVEGVRERRAEPEQHTDDLPALHGADGEHGPGRRDGHAGQPGRPRPHPEQHGGQHDDERGVEVEQQRGQPGADPLQRQEVAGGLDGVADAAEQDQPEQPAAAGERLAAPPRQQQQDRGGQAEADRQHADRADPVAVDDLGQHGHDPERGGRQQRQAGAGEPARVRTVHPATLARRPAAVARRRAGLVRQAHGGYVSRP